MCIWVNTPAALVVLHPVCQVGGGGGEGKREEGGEGRGGGGRKRSDRRLCSKMN